MASQSWRPDGIRYDFEPDRSLEAALSGLTGGFSWLARC
jgi:hypothetical protein